MNMYFNPISRLKALFLEGGGRGTPAPRLYIDLEAPAFIGLKTSFKDKDQIKAYLLYLKIFW